MNIYLTNKHKTKLADLLSEATGIILLGFSGKLYRTIMVLLFPNMMQIFLLLKNSYECILARSAELLLSCVTSETAIMTILLRGDSICSS